MGPNRMGPRRIILVLVAVAFCGLVVGVSQETPSSPKEVTFNRDVAPILFKNCVVCHRPNDIAPMSLMTYKDARMWARPVRDAVVQRKMPPWHADPKVGDFSNDPRLTDEEIATIDSWVRTGAREGDAKDLPPAPVFPEGWHIKPDVVLTIPEFTVKGSSMDDYEYIYVPTNFTEDRWVQSAEVMPGDRRVVHHATVSVIAADKVAKKEEENAKSDAGVDKYHYRTGRVLHLRRDAPVIDDGCSSPDGGGVPGEVVGISEYRAGNLPARPPGGNAAFRLRTENSSRFVFAVPGSLQQPHRRGRERSHQHRSGFCQRTGEA